MAQDPSRVYTESNGAMFAFNRCKLVKVMGFSVTGPQMDISTTKVKGNEFVQFNNGSEDLEMINNTVQGVTGGLLIKDNIEPGHPCNIFTFQISRQSQTKLVRYYRTEFR